MSSVLRSLRSARTGQLQALQRPVLPLAVTRSMAAMSSSSRAAKPTSFKTDTIVSAIRDLRRPLLGAAVPKPHPFVTRSLQGGMPQIVPFYFVGQATFGFVTLTTLIYIMSKYVLPRMVRLFLSRTFITKL